MNFDRSYYNTGGFEPFVYYVIFGVSDELGKISRAHYQVDELPAGLEFLLYSKRNPEQKELIYNFCEGSYGNILDQKSGSLARETRLSRDCMLIRGNVASYKDLNYLRNCIGIIQSFFDRGAKSVLDVMTMTWYSPTEWKDVFFGKEFNVFEHVRLLVSEVGEDGYRFYTQGMVKFGRPDINLINVSGAEVPLAKLIIEQMIYYAAHGAYFDEKFKINTSHGQFVISSQYVDDPDTENFNNVYWEVDFKDIR